MFAITPNNLQAMNFTYKHFNTKMYLDLLSVIRIRELLWKLNKQRQLKDQLDTYFPSQPILRIAYRLRPRLLVLYHFLFYMFIFQ